MAQTTADRNTKTRKRNGVPFKVSANAKINAGTIVMLSGGFAIAGTTAANLKVGGIADMALDNTGGANGEQTITCRRGEAYNLNNSSTDPIAQAHVGGMCYVEDDQTVAATDGGGTRSALGEILAIEGSEIVVAVG